MSWTALSEFDIGDHMKGAFSFVSGHLEYLTQWPQHDGAALNIHYRRVSITQFGG